MKLNNNIRILYLMAIFRSLIPAYVIERLFWAERGMTVQMVVYTEIIYAVTVTILEIPSGIWADIWGRKKSLLIDALLSVIEFIILIYAKSFIWFAFAVFLSGIGKAFSSGSGNALLYDSLLIDNKQRDFEKILGRLNALDFGFSLIAALSGGILASLYGLNINYWISLGSMGLALICTIALHEPPKVSGNSNELISSMHYAKNAILFFKANSIILYYVITSAFLGGCIIYADEFWQVFMQSVRFPVSLFGVLGSIFCLARIPGNIFAYKLGQRFCIKTLIIIVILISCLGFLMILTLHNIYGIIPFVIVFVVSGILDPLISGSIHHKLDSSIRATVDSFMSLGLRAISIVIGLVFGWITTSYSIFAGFGILGLICFVYLLWFIIAVKLKKSSL